MKKIFALILAVMLCMILAATASAAEKIVPSTTKYNLEYTGSEQILLENLGTAEDGYSWMFFAYGSNGDPMYYFYDTEPPVGTEVDRYSVHCGYIPDGSNYLGNTIHIRPEKTYTVSISPKVTEIPTAKTGLVANGTAQDLLATKGAFSGGRNGHMRYSVTDISAARPGAWNGSTATKAGEYKVWYQASAASPKRDNIWITSEPRYIIASIGEGVKNPISVGTVENGNVTFKVNNIEQNLAAAGDIVTLTAIPQEGYLFKEWQVISGGVKIENNQFVMGTEKVEINAVFEKKVDAQKPTIDEQPADASYTEGAPAAALTVTASVTDNGMLSYQWYMNDQPISGAASASYTPATETVGINSYYCVVTNTNNGATGQKTASSTSDTAVITVNAKVDAQKPTIDEQPADASYTEGAPAAALTVTASVTDGGTLSYQWYMNDQPISGAASASYTPATETVGTNSYYCVVTNTNNGATGQKTASCTSATAVITVNVKVDADVPVIGEQPASAEYTEGAQALPLRVIAAASDGGTLSYQWFEITGVRGRLIPSATQSTFTPPTDTVGEKEYRCFVTNTNTDVTGEQEASIWSDPAKVVVVAVPVVPQTGDSTPIVLLALLMTLGLAGMSMILGRKRRMN